MTHWILLRGLTRESRHWGDFPGKLSAALPGVQVHAPDLPGNGSFSGLDSPADIAAMAEACRAQLLADGIAPPYHLLAMSLGAMVAIAWASRHPQEIDACVLINTSLRPDAPFYRRLKPACYLPLLRQLLPGRWAGDREGTILRLTSRCVEDPAPIVAAWTGYAAERPVSKRNALRQLWAAMRFRAPDVKPVPPLLVLAGRRDQLVDWRCSRQLAQRWHAAYAEHPLAGHDLPLDDGPWVARQIADWVRAGYRGRGTTGAA